MTLPSLGSGQSDRKLLDAAGDHAPDFDGLTFLGHDVGKGRVGGLKLDAASPLVHPLDGEVTIHYRYDDVVMPRLDGAVHHQNVFVKDTGFHHRVPTGTQEVGRLGMGDEHLDQVNALGTEVFCGRRKTRRDPVVEQQHLQRCL